MKRRAMALLFVSLAACQGETETLPLGPPRVRIRDAGFSRVRDAGFRDAGMRPVRDGGVRDAGPILTERQLVERRLFGKMPLDNMVLNPQLDQHSTLSFIFGAEQLMERFHWPRSPMDLPLISLPSGNQYAIPVQSRDVDFDASVWIGASDRNALGRVSAFVVGTDSFGMTSMVQLIRDEPPWESYEGYEFARFSVRSSQRFLGLTFMAISNTANGNVFVTGPVVVPVVSGVAPTGVVPRRGRPTPADAPRKRQLEEIQRRLVEHARRGI